MLTVLAIIGAALVGSAVAWLLLRTRAAPAPAQTAGLQAIQIQNAALGERVAAVNDRLAALERQQQSLGESLGRVDSGLTATATLAGGLRETAESIRGQLATAGEGLTALREQARARQETEARTAAAVARLEQVIAGSAARGAAGENLVEAVFSRLPAEWQLRDFRLGNQVCEFALRLPNGLVLPIDSKWPATGLLEQLLAAEAPAERQRLKAQLETAVVTKVREAKKYVDPDLTLPFAVAVVPDAVLEACTGAQAEAFALNVVLVSHGMFVPYLLLVFQVVLRNTREIDLERLAATLTTAEQAVQELQVEVEQRLSRAITMLGNSRDSLRSSAAGLQRQLVALRPYAPAAAPTLLPDACANQLPGDS
ncbi:MAG: DNA recombination protein RmuC [Dehalococcoidia bacterium]|nr:DNA recombination protein RmuC [Dehalococcoidia bacterium]